MVLVMGDGLPDDKRVDNFYNFFEKKREGTVRGTVMRVTEPDAYLYAFFE
jgi:hypothetical protein